MVTIVSFRNLRFLNFLTIQVHIALCFVLKDVVNSPVVHGIKLKVMIVDGRIAHILQIDVVVDRIQIDLSSETFGDNFDNYLCCLPVVHKQTFPFRSFQNVI